MGIDDGALQPPYQCIFRGPVSIKQFWDITNDC